MIAGAKVTFIVEIARRQDRGRDLFVSKWKNSYSFSVFSPPFTSLFFSQFFQITRSYHTRRQRDDRDSEQGGNHADHSSEIGNGMDVAVAHGRECRR